MVRIRKLLTDPKKLGLIITAVIGALTIAFKIYDILFNSPSPDFSISVYPMQGIIQLGGVITTTITVKGDHGYKEPIRLSDSEQSSGIKVAFSISENEPTYASMITIATGSDVSIGSHELIIKGVGSDGKEHIAKYTLIVLPSAPVHPPAIKITSPKEGDRVQRSIIVNGIISGELPQGQYMWVVINPYPYLGIWRPQEGRIEPWKGQWNIKAKVGSEKEDIGKKFDIAVILVDEKDNQYYWNYLEGQKNGESY